MKNIAIICEYNPFHKGHEEQINIIKHAFGEDVCIISVMSGSVVQRGEVAVYNKYKRAEAAVRAGVSLVLELPYPYSGSCAEIFATAGVNLIASLGLIDCLVFGSECGDTEKLKKISARLSSKEFENEMMKLSALHPEYSHPQKRSVCYRELFGDELTVTPNDILGIEYIKAIENGGFSITPVTYKRQPGYSAGQSRRILLSKGDASECISGQTLEVFKNEDCVDMNESMGKTLLCFCQMTPKEYFSGVFDISSELAGKIKKAAMSSTTFEEMVNSVVSSRFTRARVKRSLLYAYLAVMKKPKATPSFTNVLAADEKGLLYLSDIKKKTSVKLITKPSSYTELSDDIINDYTVNLRADTLFCQASEPSFTPNAFLTFGPYIKKK